MSNESRFASALLRATAPAWAAGAVDRHLERDPGLSDRYPGGFTALAGDVERRVRWLAEALHFDREPLFLDQVAWWKVVYASRGWPLADLVASLEALREELADRLPDKAAAPALSLLDRGLAHLGTVPAELPSLLEAPGPHVDLLRRYVLALLEGRRDDAVGLVVRAADAGTPVEELYQHVLQPAQVEIGQMWQRGELHVGEEHFATQVTLALLERLRDRQARRERNGRRVIVSSVCGDLHDVALHMVAQCLEAAGFEALFLGASTPPVDLARAALDFRADLVAVSAHLAEHVRAVEELIQTLRATPELAHLPVLVGGPLFERVPELVDQIGADASARDPFAAVEVARRLVGLD